MAVSQSTAAAGLRDKFFSNSALYLTEALQTLVRHRLQHQHRKQRHFIQIFAGGSRAFAGLHCDSNRLAARDACCSSYRTCDRSHATGDTRMHERPPGDLVDALTAAGATPSSCSHLRPLHAYCSGRFIFTSKYLFSCAVAPATKAAAANA